MSSNKQSSYIFPVLNTNIISYDELYPIWGEDKRYPETAIQKFVLRNSELLKFMDIKADGAYNVDEKYVLRLTTSRYIGCVPLLSPRTGLSYGNLIIKGRFGEDVSELLSVIEDFVQPEYLERYKLNTGSFIKPPLYFECQNYIDKYIDALNYKWRKFNNIVKIEQKPSSSTQWDKYALKSFDPNNTFKYSNRCNILSRNHHEWAELNAVLDICIREIQSSRTPIRSKMAYSDKIVKLSLLYDKRNLPFVSGVKVHMSDPVVIKSLKECANRVLQNVNSSYFAWRLDFAEFFERYVQYLFKDIARKKGARYYDNPKYGLFGNKPGWSLNYLEPDIVLDKDDIQYIIDAKYKAHMYNVNNGGEDLKESFRADFHQVLAYSSFGGARQKNVMLVYPSDYFTVRDLNVISKINGYSCRSLLVGIPLKIAELSDVKARLAELITF